MSEVGAIATGFHRFLLALPLLALLAELEHRRDPVATPRFSAGRTRLLIVLAGLLFAADIAFWHWSIERTTVANATLLTNFAPVFVTFGAWLFFRERPTGLFALGLVLALVGAALLVGASFNLSREHLIGDILGLTSAVFYGGYQLAVKQARRGRTALPVILGSTSVTAFALLILAISTEGTLLPGTLRGWLLLVGLALVAQVMGQGLIVYGLAHLPSGFSSVTLLVQPIVAALLAWTLLGESLTTLALAGGVIVLTGIVLARLGSSRRGRVAAA